VCKDSVPYDAAYCARCASDRSGENIPTGGLAPGTILGNQYRIVGIVGHGGMGAVYRAYDQSLDREVAIKVLAETLSADSGFVDRFLREARLAAKLDHPNIVPIHGVGSEGGINYFIMKVVEGRTLKWMIQSQQVRLGPIVNVITQVCDALSAIHDNGYVHRDIKPSNVMVNARGHVTLLDFGVLRSFARNSDLTHTGTVVGTPYYMAPEQARDSRKVDHRSDLYSLGVILYEVMTGRLPFDSPEPFDVILKHVTEAPPPPALINPKVTAEVSAVILRALEKSQANRFQTAAEFKRALLEAVRLEPLGESTPAPPPTSEMEAISVSELTTPVGAQLPPSLSSTGTGSRPFPITKPVSTVHRDPASGTGIYGETGAEDRRRAKRFWRVAIVGGAVAAAVGSGAFWIPDLFGSKPSRVESTEPPPKASVAAPATVTAPAPATVTAPAPASAPARAPAPAPVTARAPAPASAHAPTPPPPRPRATSATLKVHVTCADTGKPCWANISLDGSEPQTTKLAVLKAKLGKRKLTVDRDGYQSVIRSITLFKPNEDIFVTLKVNP
jgi:serine/threonine protein kinase